jgi:hypothetical protein
MYNKTAGSPTGWKEKYDLSVRTAVRKDEMTFSGKCIFTGFWEICTFKRTTLLRRVSICDFKRAEKKADLLFIA